MHDYILVYSKSKLFDRKLLPRTEKQDKAYKNPDNDPRGPWKAVDYTSNKTRQERPNLYYPLIHPSTGKEVWPKKSRVWGFAKELHEEHIKDNRIWWGHNNENSIPALKRFLSEVQSGIVPVTWWPHEDGGHTDEAKKEVLQILDKLPGYMTPKPTRLIQRILQITTSENDLVIDSFAGSGTTGHAVLKQNSEDGGKRRFILIEMESSIATPITSKRLNAVIDGYKGVEGLGGGLRYCELGTTLFDPNRQIRDEVKYSDLAQHVYFVETGQPLPQNAKKHFPLLGVSNGTAVYLLYNGILKDKSMNGGNVLTYDVLENIPKHDGVKVIYGNGSRISKARLNDLGILFKQIPYEIREM